MKALRVPRSELDIDQILQILPHRWPFVMVDRVTELVPGDRLDLEVTVIQHRTNVWKLKGEASVDGTLCAQSELLASVVDRGG